VADGAVIEHGHHDDLVAAGGHYAGLHQIWSKSMGPPSASR
jgi:ABC-type multidrug transport system fused ATPase/permease subunit